jgi:hypothetical protein
LSRYNNGLWAGRPGFDSLRRQGLSLFYSAQAVSGAHPTSYKMETGSSFTGVKRPGSEADHLPPYSAEVMNSGTTPSLCHTSLGTALPSPTGR